MKVVLTGAGGFLGWHTRVRLHAQGQHEVVPVTRHTWEDLGSLLRGADAVIHLAGVNRAPSAEEVRGGNARLAEDLATALPDSCRHIVYANSSQAGNETPYGDGKQAAAEILGQAADRVGAHLVDVQLPNIFGEHGRPRYNSFVATFVGALIEGEQPSIQDRDVPLLHAQDAAQELIEGLSLASSQTVHPRAEPHGVQEVWDLLAEFHRSYSGGEIPALTTPFRVNLFNTYRAALFPQHTPIALTPRTDHRGTFVETVRCRGGEGQSSVSTTAPGVTRGEHYHLRKCERFAVLEGHATIALRKMFTDEVLSFPVTGEEPVAIDMPTGWVHNITNTGDTTLLTQFWSHELFDPDDPDTYAAPVAPNGAQESAV